MQNNSLRCDESDESSYRTLRSLYDKYNETMRDQSNKRETMFDVCKQSVDKVVRVITKWSVPKTGRLLCDDAIRDSAPTSKDY